MVEQPGYDAMADIYAGTFSEAFGTPLEQRVVDVFVDLLRDGDDRPMVCDIGCGTGHIAGYLSVSGIGVVGIDPSPAMLAHARRGYPGLSFVDADAWASEVALEDCSGVIARFSLIHVEPQQVRQILASWFRRLTEGSLVLIACQGSDNPGVHEFDHAVARAWRWHPDTLADALTSAGFTEVFRTVSRPGEGFHRFPEVHIVAKRSVAQGNGDDVRS
ncbi:methyltransferase domain-containing protein [Gordonia amarae]|uniref:Methyltransferase domain-containing protein n=3 Tax=Gordonia amarae TaxID=36821 RepID=A0A857M666_9ACTN|nr:class I SAM-dependent methyltransferase [Gordonia amarae]GAB05721.1 putative methyltransferase [Gordonia amarae NBRC 15530]QHN15622.1 methyltransferase domain-containing protein [Gordonia amarae]QHN20191.1 methyltransferase domain-containing protein [Gordonia amarae]QHN29042.1 methyltransferase domain-containing protein [Gordonia amarae]QHN37823.1 methyltransferase domain-containing protein [Gordonia amarae]